MDPRYGIILGPAIFLIAGMIAALTAKPRTMRQAWIMAAGGAGALLGALTVAAVLFSGHHPTLAIANSVSSYLPGCLLATVLTAALLKRGIERRELQRRVREINLKD